MIKFLNWANICVLLTLFSHAHASSISEIEDRAAKLQQETYAELAKTTWALPVLIEDENEEERMLEKVYGSAPKDQPEIQEMIQRFRAEFKTISTFKEKLEIKTRSDGPLSAHQLILSYANLLIHYELECGAILNNPLMEYYLLVFNAAAIQNATEYRFDKDLKDQLQEQLGDVYVSIKHLFHSEHQNRLSAIISFEEDYVANLMSRKKDKITPIKIKGGDVTINTSDIKSVIHKVPSSVVKVTCNSFLSDHDLMLLISKLEFCQNLLFIGLMLDMPSPESFKSLIQFLDKKTTDKKFRLSIDFNELNRLDPLKYEQIKALDHHILYRDAQSGLCGGLW